LVWLLAGCAGAPPPPPAPPAPPPQAALRGPQEAALERALGAFDGAPYRAGGSALDGVDCSGLIQAVFYQAGLKLPRTVAQQFSEGRPVASGELRFGDVVFFNRFCQTRKNHDYYLAGIFAPASAQEVCHNGIYVGQGRFVHASPKGVYVSRLDAEVWRLSFMGARRYLPQ
jgi:cell wall-associated NlpC family hydrolase